MKKKEPGKKPYGLVIFILFMVAVVIALLLITRNSANQSAQRDLVSYSQFREELEKGHVSKVIFDGQLIDGTFEPPLEIELTQGETTETQSYATNSYSTAGPTDGSAPAEFKKIVSFRTFLPPVPDNELLDLLEQRGVPFETRTQNNFAWSNVLYWLSLVVFSIFLFWSLRRSTTGQGDGLTNMLQSRAQPYDKAPQNVTFHDVAGLSGVKQELQEVIEFLQNPLKFQAFGATVPKGVLLTGPPGTGKTLLARAVAGESNAAFFPISGSDFMELYVGVGASRVRDLFKRAKANAPAIIFIDELDSIGHRRGAGFSGGHEEREQTLNQLLAEMDGFEKHENIVLMAATNRPDVLDPALLRPGRFDRQIVVDSPTVSERLAILQVHSHNKPFSEEVDLEKIARGTPGFSGADLANLLNEAALLAIRRKKTVITSQEIDDAADKVMLGLERELVLTENERCLLACHEAGHTIIALNLPNTDPVHKVTIIPRGRAMGVTQQLPERDRYLFDRDYILDRLAVLMGGRAAEELVFNAVTSGAADDLKQATRFARKMVLDLGMSEALGHMSLRSQQEDSFLGDDWSARREYSELTAQRADQEISQILETAYQRAIKILKQNRKGLDQLIEALLEKEQLLGPELSAIMSASGGGA